MAGEPVEVARNDWGQVLNYEQWRTLELRWLPSTRDMNDDGFKATLELFAGEGERLKPAYMIIDATQFNHELGEGVMEWRDAQIIPRYNSAGVTKFAFLVSEGAPGTVEKGGTPQVDGPANFPTGWFSGRERAYKWLTER